MHQEQETTPATKSGLPLAEPENYTDVDFQRLGRMAMLAHLGYRNHRRDPTTKALDLPLYHIHDLYNDDRSEHCRIYEDDKQIVIAFEGSSPNNNLHMKRNINYGRSIPFRLGTPKMTPSPLGGESKIHPGFAESLFGKAPDYTSLDEGCLASKIVNYCKELNDTNPRPISFTGHSAGAAQAAILASYMLEYQPELALKNVYTFGCPRFAGKYFMQRFEKEFEGRYFRVELLDDPITAWPPYEREHYVHGGRQIVLDRDTGSLLQSCEESGNKYDSYSRSYAILLPLFQINRGRPTPLLDQYHAPANYVEALLRHIGAPKQSIDGLEAPNRHGHVIPFVRLQSAINDASGDEAANQCYYWSIYAAEKLKDHVEANASPANKPALEALLHQLERHIYNHYGVSKREGLKDIADTLAECYVELSQHCPLPDDMQHQFETGLMTLATYLRKTDPHLPPVQANAVSRA